MDSPNLLCISIDSLRADFCSFIDEEEDTTPVLQSLSEREESATFHSAIAPSIWTLAVHGSVFTGLYPEEHQLHDKGLTLGDHPTFAELLSDIGYETYSFGFNGWLRQGDILRGFTHRTTERYENERSTLQGVHERVRYQTKSRILKAESKDRHTVENAAETLTSVERPFCGFVHIQNPHYKYAPHTRFQEAYDDLSVLQILNNRRHQHKLYDKKINRYLGGWNPPKDFLETTKNLYRACIKEADQHVGYLIETLRRNELLEETVIVVFGDHGESFGENGIYGHNFSFDESLIRIPLVVFDPTGTVEPGNREDIVQTNDLYPTLGTVLDIDVPDTQSVSFSEPDSRDSAFIHYRAAESMYNALRNEVESCDRNLPKELPDSKMVSIWRSPSQKLTWFPESGRYTSASASPDTLRLKLNSHLDSLEPVPTAGRTSIDESTKKNLKKMGYL